MKFTLLALLVSIAGILLESRRRKGKKVKIEDHKEPLHPAAFSLR